MRKTFPTTLAVFVLESALPDSLKSQLEYVSHCQSDVGQHSIIYWIPPVLSKVGKLQKPATITRFQYFIDQLEFRLSDRDFDYYVTNLPKLQEDQTNQTPAFENLRISNPTIRPRFIQELSAFKTIITLRP